MKLLTLMFCGLSALLSMNALAGEDDHAKSIQQLSDALTKKMIKVKTSNISATPIEGLYQVIVGTQVVYMSDDARYMIQGDLFDMSSKKNITEDAKSEIRLAAINNLGEENMLVYKPEKVSGKITVITDIDCPYCRKLHNEVPNYLENNIEVRYIFMPLKGSSDMKKTVSVWCSEDKHDALDTAKTGGVVDEKSCDNPIQEHLKLARELGVRGTPAIILEDGQMLPGYLPYDKLLAELAITK